MKFAVITDIHGNYPALKAVLAEIDNAKTIQHIYCLGDLLAIGPDTNEVLIEIFSRSDLSIVTGNHDEAVLAILKNEKYPESHNQVRKHHEWVAEQMQSDLIGKLSNLPRVICESFEGKKVLFTHYQIAKSKLDKHISEDPFSSIVEPNLADIETLFDEKDMHLICFGHHHPTHFFENDKTIFLNPGALGCHDKPMARYAVVDITRYGINVELKEAEYDNREFLLSYEKLEVPESDFILKVFHGDQLANG